MEQRTTTTTSYLLAVYPPLPIVIRGVELKGRLRREEHVEQEPKAQENHDDHVRYVMVRFIHDTASEGQETEEHHKGDPCVLSRVEEAHGSSISNELLC